MKLTHWSLLLVSLFAATALANASESSSVKQYDITWTFDKPVQTGQFVNGDWWVVPADGQDAITVLRVDPAPKTTSDGKLMNGSMVNPMPGSQAFDQRVLSWKGNQGATYPVTLKINQSLVSAVSFTEEETAGKTPISKGKRIKYIAVLTCLSQPAWPTDFRPPYVGADKPIYSSLKLRRDLLPNLPLPASVKNVPNLNDLTNARFSRPWADFTFNGQHGIYDAEDGCEKAVDVGGAGLLLCLDKKIAGDKEPLLIGLVQTGIDLYGTLVNGGRWQDETTVFMGRKFPILFAGLMLDDKDMLNIGRKYPPESRTFQEDIAAFIVSKADVGRQLDCTISGPVKAASSNTIGVMGGSAGPGGLPGYTVLRGNHIKIVDGPGAGQVRLITATSDSGQHNSPPAIVTCTIDPPWDVVPEVGKSVYQVLGYQEEDIGHAKWGCSHWVNSNPTAFHFQYHNPKVDNPSNYQNYGQQNKGAWPAEVLAARILSLKEAWNQDAVFQLIDEYVAETAPGGPFDGKYGGAPRFYGAAQDKDPWPKYSIDGDFIGAMWDAYRGKFGNTPP